MIGLGDTTLTKMMCKLTSHANGGLRKTLPGA